MAEILANCKLQ